MPPSLGNMLDGPASCTSMNLLGDRSRYIHIIFSVWVAILVTVQGQLSDDAIFTTGAPQWPKPGYDLQNTGKSPYKVRNSNPLAIIQFETKREIATSPAISSTGEIIFISGDNYLYCLSSEGSVRWKFMTNGSEHSPVIGPSGDICYGDQNAALTCLTSEGSLHWQFTTKGAVSTPTFTSLFAHGYILAVSSDSYLYCLTAYGSLRWKYLGNSNLEVTPVISHTGDIVLPNGGNDENSLIVCLSIDGEHKWNYTIGGLTNGLAIDSQGRVIFAHTINYSGFYITCLTSEGGLVWSIENGLIIPSAPAINPVTGDFAVATYMNTIEYYSSEGLKKWSHTAGFMLSSPIFSLDGDVLVSGGDDKKIWCLTPSGAVRWQYSVGGDTQSSPVITESGNVVFGSYDQKLWVLGESPTSLPTLAPTTSPPTVSPSLSPTKPAKIIIFGDRVVLGASSVVAVLLAVFVFVQRSLITNSSQLAEIVQSLRLSIPWASQATEALGGGGVSTDESRDSNKMMPDNSGLCSLGAVEVLLPVTLSVIAAASNLLQIYDYLTAARGSATQTDLGFFMMATRVCVVLHSSALLVLTFNREAWSMRLVPKHLHKATLWVVVGAITLVDASHIRLLPWRRSEFVDRSRGFPTFFLFKSCLLSSALSSLVQFSLSLARGVTASSLASFTLSLASFLLAITTAAVKLIAEKIQEHDESMQAEQGQLRAANDALQARVAELEAENARLGEALRERGIELLPLRPPAASVPNPLLHQSSQRLRPSVIPLWTIYDDGDKIPSPSSEI